MDKLKLKEELTLKGTQTVEPLLEKSKVQLEPDRCSHDPRTWWGNDVQRDVVFLDQRYLLDTWQPLARLIHPCQWSDLVHCQRSEVGFRVLFQSLGLTGPAWALLRPHVSVPDVLMYICSILAELQMNYAG